MPRINKTLFAFITFNFIFLLSAGLHLFIPLYTRSAVSGQQTLDNVASNLLLDECPLTAAIVNAVLMFISFAISLPAIFRRQNLILLQIHAWIIVVCAIFTLSIGLEIWYSTLETHVNLAPIWNKQTTFVQSLLQFKFKCCGYNDPNVFVQDGTCANAAEVARLGGCVGPFGVFANQFLDVVFTTFFGFVAVDMMALLSVLCVLKERKEEARYRLIDEKNKISI